MFRRFKLPVLYAAVLVAIGYYLYQFLDFAFNISDWTTQRRGLWSRLWAAATSREGSVVVTGLLAVFVLTTVLVEKRRDAARDLKWKRRKRVMDGRIRRLSKTKTTTLTDAQRSDLFALQQQIKVLHEKAKHAVYELLEADIRTWEEKAGAFLETALDREHRAFVMDAPYQSASRPGFARQNHLIGWTQKRLEQMNALIDELRN